MAGYDSNMLYLSRIYEIDSNGDKATTYTDRIIPFSSIKHIVHQPSKSRVLISRNGYNDSYVDLKEGETLLDFYGRCLIPLPDSPKKKRGRDRRKSC